MVKNKHQFEDIARLSSKQSADKVESLENLLEVVAFEIEQIPKGYSILDFNFPLLEHVTYVPLEPVSIL